jgi:hypothetical protein
VDRTPSHFLRRVRPCGGVVEHPLGAFHGRPVQPDTGDDNTLEQRSRYNAERAPDGLVENRDHTTTQKELRTALYRTEIVLQRTQKELRTALFRAEIVLQRRKSSGRPCIERQQAVKREYVLVANVIQ